MKIDRRRSPVLDNTLLLLLVLLGCQWADGFLSHAHLPLCPEPSLLRHAMFTGVIDEIGTVVALEERNDMEMADGSKGKGTELTVQADSIMNGAYQGCNICVSGVCLTATDLDKDKNTFKVGLAPETTRRTYLASLNPGDRVNLERASEIGGRNSGHFVQGHVDGFAKITDKWQESDSLFFQVKVPPGDIMNYIIPKGFVAIDGTSLTISEVDKEESWFTFMLVDFTQKKIVLPDKDIGDPVNIEVDVLGKYSDNAMKAILPRIEELEFQYESLQSKARELEAMNQGLVHKLQSLESARLLEYGSATRATSPAPQQHETGRARTATTPAETTTTPAREIAETAAAAPKTPPQDNNVRRVKGPEAARINNEWRQQQEQMRDQYKVRRIQDENIPFAGVHERKAQEGGRKRVVGGPDARRIQDEWLRSQGKTVFEKEMVKESNIQDAQVIDVGDRDPFMGLSPDQDKQNTESLLEELEGNFAPEDGAGPIHDTPVIRNGVRHPAAQKGPVLGLKDAQVVDDERWNQRPRQFGHLPDAKQVDKRQSQQPQQQQQWNHQGRRMMDQRPPPGMQEHMQPPGPSQEQDRRMFGRPPPENFVRNGNSGQQPQPHPPNGPQQPPPQQHPQPPNVHPYFRPMGEFSDPWYDQSGPGRNPDVGGAGPYGPDDHQQQTRHTGTRDVLIGMKPDTGLHVNDSDDKNYPKTRELYHDQWPQTFGMSGDGKHW
ncbi:Riboflavin synthase [Seminavis robusta]|uniref:Riboflavin synthase n=1 Tax=Seminavis robusta TaxID=568900 RepID=A0A9N8EP45_9STRA|nr:Riboflavin synthase [Seminavis robusta]|eukprot:Sro1468_g275220.1 Riboflavin synthase (719) ;mRNA; f:17078-19475